MRPSTDEQLVQEAQYDFPYHYLDLAVDSYRLRRTEYLNLVKLVTERVAALGSTVLDAACGDGRLCFELHRKGLEVTGVDYSERAIAFACAFNPGVEFQVVDLTRMQLGRDFDVVVLMEALEHFPPEQAPLVVKTLSDHLADDGRLIVTVPSDNLPVAPKHYRHFDPTLLSESLAPHFEVVRLEGYYVQGRRLRLFHTARRLAYLVSPLADRSRAVRRMIEAPVRYYDRRLALGPPDRAGGLIATCVKR